MIPNNLKTYILVREDIGIGHAINCVAHASVAATLKWKKRAIFNHWLKSFKKVTCKVSRGKFEEAKQYGEYIVISEDVLNNVEVAMIFLPQKEWPEFFKNLRLYS